MLTQPRSMRPFRDMCRRRDEQPDLNILPPHDHPDNFNGGFSFPLFSMGTQIPQQPWSL
jgi:hypothetical protein